MNTPAEAASRRFASSEYRILAIHLGDGDDHLTTVFERGRQTRREPTRVRFGAAFRLRVDYECLTPELPEVSCGVAAAFTRVGDMEPIMYFNTNYPHSDDEIRRYDEIEFRRYIGRFGSAEARLPRLQVRPGDYLLTVGILPNRPVHHEFHELHYLQYPIAVTAAGAQVPAIFWPQAAITRHLLEGATPPSSGLADTAEAVTPAMVQTGVAALRAHAPVLPDDPQALVTAVYAAMRRRAGEG